MQRVAHKLSAFAIMTLKGGLSKPRMQTLQTHQSHCRLLQSFHCLTMVKSQSIISMDLMKTMTSKMAMLNILSMNSKSNLKPTLMFLPQRATAQTLLPAIYITRTRGTTGIVPKFPAPKTHVSPPKPASAIIITILSRIRWNSSMTPQSMKAMQKYSTSMKIRNRKSKMLQMRLTVKTMMTIIQP